MTPERIAEIVADAPDEEALVDLLVEALNGWDPREAESGEAAA